MNEDLLKKELALHSCIIISEKDEKFKELQKECPIDPQIYTMFADPITNLIHLVKSAAQCMATQLLNTAEIPSKGEHDKMLELYNLLLEKFYETKGLYGWQRESS